MKIKNLLLISIFLVITILFVPNIVNAADGDTFVFEGNNYKVLSEANKEVEITDYMGDAQEFIIPQEVTNNTTNTNYKVTSIGDQAFRYNKTLKNVVIPNTIVSIGDSAFYGCEELLSLELPDSVRTIERHAFRLCTKVESIRIPEGVEIIEDGIFEYCYSLKEIQLPSTLTTIKDMIIQGCNSLECLEIPSSVNSLGNSVFINSGLLELHFKGDKPATIGTELFKGAKENLTIYVPREYYDSYKNVFDVVNVSYCKIETKDNVDTYTIYCADGKNITFDVTNGINGIDGTNGKDGITPKLQINSKGELEVSYDEGTTWIPLGNVVGKNGIDGIDGVTPKIQINNKTGELEVSYDNGKSWSSLGKVVGDNGKNGVDGKDGNDGVDGKDGKDGKNTSNTTNINGTDGKDGITPKIQINNKTGELEVSYDNGKSWSSLGKVVGDNGITPRIRVNSETNELEVSYDESGTWGSLGVNVETGIVIQQNGEFEYGIREYIIISLLGFFALTGNLGWALKRKK